MIIMIMILRLIMISMMILMQIVTIIIKTGQLRFDLWAWRNGMLGFLTERVKLIEIETRVA